MWGSRIIIDNQLYAIHNETVRVRYYKKKSRENIYEYAQLVESYRVGIKSFRRVHAFLGRTDDPHSVAFFLKQFAIENILQGEQPKLYALPTAIYTICIKDLSLPNILMDIFRSTRIATDVSLLTMLMIIHRIIDPDAKLALTRWYKNILLPVPLPQELDVHNLYYTLDYLMSKKEEIEKQLYHQLQKAQLIDATVVFYDLTSSYFEGEEVPMAAYGYSRDHRPDLLQITLGLVIDKNGYPIYHEVLPGNTQDKATVTGILEKLQNNFQIKNVIFVADKGMLTPDNLEALQKKQYQSILSESIRNALSQEQRKALFLQKETFIKEANNLWYTTREDKEGTEVIVCYNQYTAEKAKETRDAKLKKLELFIAETKEKHKEETEQKEIQKVRDMLLAKLVASHARKYFDCREKAAMADLFPHKQTVIEREEHMDGMWVVRSNTKDLTTKQLIITYKDLKTIEASFRVIKDVIELRPIYHHKDNRVKGHVFICILAFLVTKILEQKTGQTIKMLREKYTSAVAIQISKNSDQQPVILGGHDVLQLV